MEYIEINVEIDGKVYKFAQLEVMAFNPSKDKGYLLYLLYETMDNMLGKANAKVLNVPLPAISTRNSYQSVRTEILTATMQDARFAGAVLKNVE